jgi:large subunit ribosomal protein L3
MSAGLIGRKLGMTQIFDEQGRVLPVTVIACGPCIITQIKTEDGDGYQALQLGFEDVRPAVLSKPELGHLEKSSAGAKRVLREFRQAVEGYQLGQALSCAEVFSAGQLVSVSGVNKGRGFAGGVKRHGWRGGKATRGSMFHRAPGSIGASAFPSRVFKGKTLPGHMGNVRVTIRNLQVVQVDAERNIILVRGAVPGANNGILEIRRMG